MSGFEFRGYILKDGPGGIRNYYIRYFASAELFENCYIFIYYINQYYTLYKKFVNTSLLTEILGR